MNNFQKDKTDRAIATIKAKTNPKTGEIHNYELTISDATSALLAGNPVLRAAIDEQNG